MREKWVYGVAAILALSGLYACWCGASMIYDGAYQFSLTLRAQQPYVYLTRFHTYFLWQPVVWLSHLTDNVQALQMAYGLPFCLAPAAAVLLSWWMVRRDAPWLIIWAIFGIAIAPLPGQIFIINDSIFQQHLFWPLFLAMFVPLTGRQVVVAALLAVFQFAHQIGIALFAGAGVALLIAAYFDPEQRKMLRPRGLVMLTLAGLALGKCLVAPDSYAASEFVVWKLRERWDTGVAGSPVAGLILMWLAGLCALIASHLSDEKAKGRFRFGIAAIACIVLGGLIWAHWASDPQRWAGALDYRRWVVPLAAPFYGLALLDHCLSRRAALPSVSMPDLRIRKIAGYLAAFVFAVVFASQSTAWHLLTRRLASQVRQSRSSIISPAEMAWAKGTAMQHWGTTAYVMVLQGRSPEKLLLDEKGRKLAGSNQPMIEFSEFHALPPRPGPGGWFDFSRFFSRLHAEQTPQ